MFIDGKNISLRGLREYDLHIIEEYANDEDITHYMIMGMKPDSGVIYCSWDSTEEEFERLMKSKNDVVFCIIILDDLPIGIVGLYNINWIDRNAELRIVIGAKDYLGKGYGTEAVGLVVKYGFNDLNLHRIYLGCNASDERANKCYQKAGFKQEGTLKDYHFRNNKYYDANIYSIIRKEK